MADYKRSDDREEYKEAKAERNRNPKFDEGRRNTKWVAFAKTKPSFGFQHLNAAFVPSMSADATGLAVCFEKVSGWHVPAQLYKEFGKEHYEINIQLSFSLYHVNSATFFGSTWMGPAISLGSNPSKNNKIIDFEYVDIIYMLSKITDPSCVGVIEVVVSKFDPKKNLTAAQFGCGFAILNLFAKPTPPDVTVGFENVDLTSCALYYGSPRDLIVHSDLKTIVNKLKPIPNCSLFFKLYSHKRLMKMRHFVAENECLGRFDTVAGLVCKSVIPQGATRERLIPCIGDEEKFNDKSGVSCVPVRPMLAASSLLKIANFQLFIPNRLSLEIKLLASTKLSVTDASKVQILARHLKVGLHNGHTILGGEWQTHSLVQDKNDPDILLSDEPVLTLNGFVPNEYMAMVFLVQYELGVPQSRINHLDQSSMVRAVNPPTATISTTVTLGSTLYIPSDGKVVWLKNSSNVSSGDGVDVELALLKDEVSSILSPNVMMNDSDAAPTEDVVVGDSRSAKNRLSLKADEKHRNTTRGAAKLKEDEDSDPMVGFDLKMFHSVVGEVLHNDNIENLLKLENKGKDASDKLNAVADAVATEKDDEPQTEDRDERDEIPRRPERQSQDKFSRTRISRSRYEDVDDDASVVAESIVSGTSDLSNYRLDPSYYYSKRRPDIGGGGVHVSDAASVRSERSDHVTGRVGIPKDRNSLMALSMKSKLAPARREIGDLLEPENSRPNELQVAPLSKATIGGNASHVRELSRGAKSRLNRHGFHQAITDSSAAPRGPAPAGSRNVVVDTDLEARDPLSMHEIRIQFAGYRAGSYQVTANSEGISPQHMPYCPRKVYASFQFFTCLPTKTEIMRVVSAKSGETCVFMRDDSRSRDETPLALRYVIDCSTSSPSEAIEFSEYLANCSLYVDLWDADSLLLIGTFAVPLRKLLRQGKSVVEHAVECDVINADIGSNNQGGISTCVVADGGPVSGQVVGAVQVIVSNYGQKGSRAPPKLEHQAIESDAFNWRAYGVENNVPVNSILNRPKNSVRARPLSEGAPQLGKVLSDMRGSAGEHGSSMRSLTTTRGAPGTSTLTYDEVAVLFKRFQGVSKGTVQYAGDFMTLLDMPSWNVASRKLIKAFELFGSRSAVEKELLRHSDANSRLEEKDLESFLRVLFDKTRVTCRPEDYKLIAHRFVFEGVNGVASVPQILHFCEDEIDRQRWSAVSTRFRAAVKSAYIDGEDVEQRLAEHDVSGEHYIGKDKFNQFLEWLSNFGKQISAEDIRLCCRHFARSSGKEAPRVSLREFMSFVGKDYVGNLQVRIQDLVRKSGKGSFKPIMALLDRASGGRPQNLMYAFGEVEEVFRELGVFSELSHDQVSSVLRSLDFKKKSKLSLKQVLNYLGVDYSASDLESPRGGKKDEEPMNIEGMLRLLLAKVQSNGIAVDEAFRHFDTNGDGSITILELEKGLTELCIFGHIPNWKEQLPALIAKFDSSGDKEVSLKEFFHFLGMSGSYAPNIIQKMTSVFAVATQKGLSIKAIFSELDDDGSGTLDVDELMSGLKKIGTFGDITRDDAMGVVAKFDENGDKKISINEFVQYFTDRVNLVVKQRRLRQAEKKTVVMQFRDVMTAAKTKGLTAKDIFGHIDKDKGGSISKDEFRVVLTGLPHFKALPEADITEVFSIIDHDGSGDITLVEFEQFVDGTIANSVATRTKVAEENYKNNVSLTDQVRDVFKTAQSKGLSFETAFSLADKDGNGRLTMRELEVCLRKLPAFRDAPVADIKAMFDVIDQDRSGLISVDEFKAFLKDGQVIADKRPAREESDQKAAAAESNALTTSEFKNKFISFTKRVLADDPAFLANLDQDEDGLVELSVLRKALNREGMFRSLSEDRVDEILEPFIVQRKFVALDELMNFVQGNYNPKAKLRQHHRSAEEGKEALDDSDTVVRDYVFSNNPEVKSLEKKIRAFGRILTKKAVDVEEVFRQFDSKTCGMVTRTQLIEVLCRLGMYVLEQGKTFDHALQPDNDTTRTQMHQISKLKGTGGDYRLAGPRMARKLLMNGGNLSHVNEFSDHLESMTLVNSYRQSQKQQLLQRVLSYNLEKTVSIFPRFGRALFFEFPLTNPFSHEERFQIDVSDPELQLVTAFDEWIHFRNTCRPCVGELGMEPVEQEMFDRDGQGGVQVVLLPHETLYIPFTFLTLLPHASSSSSTALTRPGDRGESKGGDSTAHDNCVDDDEAPRRRAEVKFISGSHGHVVSVLRVLIYPRPFVLHRTLRFFEPENSILKRRILLVGHENMSIYPGEFTAASKYIHCVENTVGSDGSEQSKVVVEWGPSSEHFTGMGSLDVLIRYRCSAFPSGGSFYLLIYNDPYQSHLHEVWQVVVQTRQKVDLHGVVGSVLTTDLVVRGDRFARRVRAFASSAVSDRVSCQPEAAFQLVPGAYNRISFNVLPQLSGYRRLEVSLVDIDSKELVSAWVLALAVTPPAVVRSYEVDVPRGRCVHKKIIYTNPWDVSRRFTLTSSDESVMRPRARVMDVPPRGSAFMRLWFTIPPNSLAGKKEAHLFLADADDGQNEECYLFKIHSVSS